MTRYELFKLIHLLGVIGWVGGGVGLLILHHRMVTARDAQGLAAFQRQSQALGTWLFFPAFVLTLGGGIAMVATESFLSFTDLWILIGFGGIVASGVAEGLVAGPAGKRYAAAVEAHGIESKEALDAASRTALGPTLDMVALLVVVWAMVVKPVL